MPRHLLLRNKRIASLGVAYVRVSTDLERQALGNEAQVVAIREWCAKNGVEVASWFTEEVSGGASLEKRPVLVQALAEVAVRRAGFLVVQRLDRFSRDPLTAAVAEAELRRSGATLVCADGTASGDDPTSTLVRGILISVANFEKALIRSRIRAALAVKKARGEVTGRAPYGFKVAQDRKTLIADPHETAVLAELRRMRAAGMTIRAIRDAATRGGLLSRAGTPFTIATVHAMVTRTDTHACTRPEGESPSSRNTPAGG